MSTLGGTPPLNGSAPLRSRRTAASSAYTASSCRAMARYDVGVLVLFLFEVVFMETAGYIIIGAIAERISFAGFILAEIAMGAVIYPIYGMWVWGGGWLAHLGTSRSASGHGAVDFAGSGVVHGTGGWAALALAMVLGPADRQVQQGRLSQRDPGPQPRVRRHRHAWSCCSAGWASTPARRSARPTCASVVVAVNTLLSACVGFVIAMTITEREVRQARHLDVVQRHARRPGRDHRALRVRRAVGRGRDRRRRRRRSSCYGVAFFDKREGRRSVRRDLGARRERRVGRARGRSVRRRHLRRRLERCRPAT